RWDAAATGGSALFPFTTLVGATTYTVSPSTAVVRSDGPRVAVSMTVTAVPAPDLDEREQTFCEIDMATVADLNTAGGTGVLWYAAVTGGTALDPGTALVGGTTYYATQTTADGCESVLRSAVEVTITVTPAPDLDE